MITHLSFRILFLCIFLPPLFYIFTLQGLESYFKSEEKADLERILIQNPEALYAGRYTVKEEVNRNINTYLKASLKHSVGLRINILVKTRDDRILYPTQFGEELQDHNSSSEFSSLPMQSLNYMEIATENYKILNEGLSLLVDVQIEHNTWLSNSILLFYLLLSAFILHRAVKVGIRKAEKEEAGQKALIHDLSLHLADAEEMLKVVAAKEQEYVDKITTLKKEKEHLSKDIDGLLDQMGDLEEGLNSQRAIREQMTKEVEGLRQEMDRIKVAPEKTVKKKKKADATAAGKRFRVLYKNLDFTDRSLEGFFDLTAEFQLKAEEIIHRLNEDDSQVQVKRKVFSKGGKSNVLEVDFSYSGRLYFQKDGIPKKRIVAIGTKNTQEQDLEYLEGMK